MQNTLGLGMHIHHIESLDPSVKPRSTKRIEEEWVNDVTKRSLLEELESLQPIADDKDWLFFGDFNAILKREKAKGLWTIKQQWNLAM